jgi:hypothetical protein
MGRQTVHIGTDANPDEMVLIGHCGALRLTTEDGRQVTIGRDSRRRWRKRARR